MHILGDGKKKTFNLTFFLIACNRQKVYIQLDEKIKKIYDWIIRGKI